MKDKETGDRIGAYIRFIQEAEQLKSTLRTAWAASGRKESTAEHSWRMALMAALFLEEYPKLDGKRVLLMCLIHDIGEVYDGDISAALLPDQALKHQEERTAAEKIFSYLPEKLAGQMMEVWEEYNDNSTPEAHFVKAMDKAETIIQHNQGKNPPDFDYEFNLQYGAACFAGDETLAALKERLDGETKKHIK